MNKEEIEKNNELFSNSLALKIMGAEKMTKVLRREMSNKKASEVMQVYKNFLHDFEDKLKNL